MKGNKNVKFFPSTKIIEKSAKVLLLIFKKASRNNDYPESWR